MVKGCFGWIFDEIFGLVEMSGREVGGGFLEEIVFFKRSFERRVGVSER